MDIPNILQKIGMIAVFRRGSPECCSITRIEREGGHLRVFFDGITTGGWLYNEDGTMWFSDNPAVPKVEMDSDIIRIVTKRQRIEELDKKLKEVAS